MSAESSFARRGLRLPHLKASEWGCYVDINRNIIPNAVRTVVRHVSHVVVISLRVSDNPFLSSFFWILLQNPAPLFKKSPPRSQIFKSCEGKNRGCFSVKKSLLLQHIVIQVLTVVLSSVSFGEGGVCAPVAASRLCNGALIALQRGCRCNLPACPLWPRGGLTARRRPFFFAKTTVRNLRNFVFRKSREALPGLKWNQNDHHPCAKLAWKALEMPDFGFGMTKTGGFFECDFVKITECCHSMWISGWWSPNRMWMCLHPSTSTRKNRVPAAPLHPVPLWNCAKAQKVTDFLFIFR